MSMGATERQLEELKLEQLQAAYGSDATSLRELDAVPLSSLKARVEELVSVLDLRNNGIGTHAAMELAMQMMEVEL